MIFPVSIYVTGKIPIQTFFKLKFSETVPTCFIQTIENKNTQHLYFIDDSAKLKYLKFGNPLSLTENKSEAAEISISSIKSLKVLLFQDNKYTADGAYYIISNNNLLEQDAWRSYSSQKIKTAWTIILHNPRISGIYLLEKNGKLLDSKLELVSFNQNNLDMNVLWEYNELTLKTYKDPAFSFSRVKLVRTVDLDGKVVLGVVNVECDEYAAESCVISRASANSDKFILLNNKLLDPDTGLCYDISTKLLAAPLNSITDIKINDKLITVANTTRNNMYSYGSSYGHLSCNTWPGKDITDVLSCANGQENANICNGYIDACCRGDPAMRSTVKKDTVNGKKCVTGACPWSELCLKNRATQDYCTMNDEFGQPRFLTDRNCITYYNGVGDNIQEKMNSDFCRMNPKHPLCACINYTETKLGKTLINGLANTPGIGSIQCMMPQCTITTKPILGKKASRDCPSNITICSSVINQVNEQGNNLIDNVSLVQICGQNLSTCAIDSDCGEGSKCFQKNGKGYCLPDKSKPVTPPITPPVEPTKPVPVTPQPTPVEPSPVVPDTPISCKYGAAVYGDCSGGKRSKTLPVVSGSCSDIIGEENCNTCKIDSDCFTGKECKNGVCENKITCQYESEIITDCVNGKQNKIRKSKIVGCKDIITEVDCTVPVPEEPVKPEPEEPSGEEPLLDQNKIKIIIGGSVLLLLIVIAVMRSRK